jgi:hypothetical protein
LVRIDDDTDADTDQNHQTAGGPSHHATALPSPGTDILLPVGVLQMTAEQVMSPAVIRWFYLHNKARLEEAVRRGVPLDQVISSPITGLVVFPMINDATFRLPGNWDVEPYKPHPATLDILWEEFLGYVNINGTTPLWWKAVSDILLHWRNGAVHVSYDDVQKSCGEALWAYLRHFVPIHLAYQLLPNALGNPDDWWSGKLKKGRISKEHLVESLGWAVSGQPDAKPAMLKVMSSLDKFPMTARNELGRLFDRCSRPEIPRICRHSFAGDSVFCEEVAAKLAAEYGEYEELDFKKLILPLPATWKEEEPLMSHRAGAPRVGLIVFD